MSILTAGKVEPDLKWIWLDQRWIDFVSQQTLELCDIHFITKYENDVHNTSHKMGWIQRIKNDALKTKLWQPLFYFHSQKQFLENYQTRKWAIWNSKLGLKRWHCLEWSEVGIAK